MAKGDCVRCTHCAVCKHRSSNEQPWVEEHCKLAAREESPHEKWEYLKEHITEMRDADGKANQTETCQFILNLMGVIEREGDRNEQTTD